MSLRSQDIQGTAHATDDFLCPQGIPLSGYFFICQTGLAVTAVKINLICFTGIGATVRGLNLLGFAAETVLG